MQEKINRIFDSFNEQIATVQTPNDLNEIKVRYLGKNGEITDLLKGLKNCTPQEKPVMGKLINELRTKVDAIIAETMDTISLSIPPIENTITL